MLLCPNLRLRFNRNSKTEYRKPLLLPFLSRAAPFFCLSVFLAACVWCGEAPAPLRYAWKKDDLSRFEYSKKITVKQPDEKGVTVERTTEAKAVLVLEIRNLTPAGAVGTLRFDSPHITLPAIKFFSAQYDEPEDQPDKSRAVARALEGAIKQARWSFTWSEDGALRIEARAPANLQEWLKEPANAGTWRKKASAMLASFVEQDLGLRAQTVDRELLLCFTSGNSGLPPASSPIRPVRSAPVVLSRSKSKVELGFQRSAPPPLPFRGGDGAGAGSAPAQPGTPFAIHISPAAQGVQACLQGVTTTRGSATYDTKLLMLDSLDEEYKAEVLYTSGKDTLRQELQVEYHLKRLAPAIVQPE